MLDEIIFQFGFQQQPQGNNTTHYFQLKDLLELDYNVANDLLALGYSAAVILKHDKQKKTWTVLSTQYYVTRLYSNEKHALDTIIPHQQGDCDSSTCMKDSRTRIRLFE